MRCICGKKCCGADLIGQAPECIVVYEGSDLPYKFRNDLGFIGSIALGFLDGLMIRILFVVYQCPSCSCFIVYAMYKDNDGQHNRKVIESKNC